jgi:uncharacterized protein
VAAFARQGARCAGLSLLAEFERLSESVLPAPLPDAQRIVDWQFQGELRTTPGAATPSVWLHVHAHATVPLRCQRCLQAVAFRLDLARSVRFVATEAEAAEQDLDCEEDVEPLVTPWGALNGLEDELLPALPLAPRHDACPAPLQPPPKADSLPSPFAVLGQLKLKKNPGQPH